jgi:hypothetical protein
MNILLGEFSAKVGKRDIFKPRVGIKSLHKNTNDNEVEVINVQKSNCQK